MYSSIVALAANTPGADGTLFQWSWFIFNKYSTLFLKATWVTLYVSLIGTILGFILGFAVGIINTVQIHKYVRSSKCNAGSSHHSSSDKCFFHLSSTPIEVIKLAESSNS